MNLKAPMKQFYKNMMLTRGGDVYTYYSVSPEMIPTNNAQSLREVKDRFTLFFKELERYGDFHLEMYPHQMNLRERFDEIEKDFHEDTKEAGKYYNKETIQLLEQELGAITQYQFILGVRLKSVEAIQTDYFAGALKGAFSSVTDQLVNMFGFEREADHSLFERFSPLEEDLFQLVQTVGGKRLSEDSLVYVNRYTFLRDIHHSVEEQKKMRGITNITNCIIDPTEMGYLKLSTPEGETYISHLVVDDFSLDMEYSHLFQRAQSLPFPVEVHIKAQFQNKDAILRKVSFTKKRLQETDRDMAEAGEDVDDKISKGRHMLSRLTNELRNEDVGFLHWVATIVVTGRTKEECKSRATSVRRYMKFKEISCVQPVADQLQLFYKFLHGEPLSFERNWLQRTTHIAFVENLFAVSKTLGSKIGFYFGRVDNTSGRKELSSSIASSRDIVLFHPFIANEGILGAVTDSPHISITGQTGKGKSFLVKLILMYLSFLDVKVLMTDPKTEIEKWFRKAIESPEMKEQYPLFTELVESFHYITLDPHDPKNWGVLDPICFLEGYEARDTAQAVMEQIYDMSSKDDVKTAVLKTLSEVIEERKVGKKVGLMTVVERLMESEEITVNRAGQLLWQMTQNSVLQLIFSTGETKSIHLDGKVNILQIEGLDLPKEDDNPKDYSDSERKSVCMMVPLSKFCEKFGSRDKAEKTAIIFDEAWMLTGAKGGKKLINSLKRIGRSYKNQLYLVTQSVSDVNEDKDSKGNIGAKFAFDEKEERPDILKYVGLAPTESNQKMLGNMQKGQCLFSDFYGRTGKLSIDCLFYEWKEAFKTVEKSNSAKAEEEFEI
ncbi:ATP-binding protein [Rossellomorea yichunensis]|uniref:ATP-binding protein n=1 Tax=Rossellomorea yichunensis TaxID=3077331 RepID=UPI0028DFAC7D|nr:ATP-binding protein [Rossellomorea sp. YC4-1]MDT9027508.1 ATP-binding protein [Rossellomorea sp. YC4-1]